MFTNISWGNYIFVIVLLLASWYLVIGFRYYLFDITEIATGKRKLRNHRIKDLEIDYDVVHPQNFTDTCKQPSFGESEETIGDIDAFADKLKNMVKDASQREVIKSEFIGHLSSLLTEYSSIKKSPFRSLVSELIISECEKLDTMSLSHVEVEDLWNE
ncbi:hypothetical protein [Flavobacterium frigoris]|uniref:Uncharacterized protein n=1 Tax=Flavobacterium frigoris TaxID=229204 RepID=A0A1H9H6Y9_FLAFI|nr:hypothetical protein [Flavobacterium frigoris]SEQ58089.1 hypothetical protein SAMN05444355_10346 [Flavobacterium frigoris]